MNFEITSGVKHTAQKVVVYGPEGIGKSTFASQFPDPCFIDTEGSTNKLNVKRLPKPTSWEILNDEIKFVIQQRPCKTLVIDTADWAERLCIEKVCAAANKSGIEDFGYGSGYTYLTEEWGRFLNLLQDVIDIANINVVLNAHATIRKFEQPNEMGSYDRWELKLGKKTTAQTAPLTKEWADMVLFANYKTISVAVDDKGKKHKAQGGKRVMYTAHTPWWDAKNRDGLPEECEFNYDVIRHIIEGATSPLEPISNVGMEIVEAINEDPFKHDEFTMTNITNPAPQMVIDERIPQQLRDLMIANNVTEDDIEKAVASKGYFPLGVKIVDYPLDFVFGCLVADWEHLYQTVLELRKEVQF